MADSTAAWHKAFTIGSKSLQDRLKKVHAKNPVFQSWLKSSGHEGGTSVKQASKMQQSTARVKELQKKSLAAYGATKGTRMGSDDGSGEQLRDTIAPLTRDQHSKAQAAERAAKAAAKPVKPAKPAKPTKPLSQAERIAAIARAVKKAKAKDRFDVPTVNPDDMDHDDLRDVHNQLHVRGSYNEEVEGINEMDKSQPAAGRDSDTPFPTKPIKVTDKQRASAKLMTRELLNLAKKQLKKEEVEQVDEANMRFDPEAAARPKSSDVKNFLNRNKNARAAAATNKYIRRMTKLGGLGPNQTKKDTEAHMKAHFEDVEIDEAKKPLKPSYWKAEWRLGTQSEVEKNHKKIYDRLVKTDPAKAKAFHDSLMRMKNKDVGAVHSSMEKEMQKEDAAPSDKEIKMAKGIAFDKRYKGGNMTAAANAIDKIRPGLSNHPKVANALRAANEEKEMSYGKKIAKIMLAKQSKHPIAQNMGEEKDKREYGYEGDMAKSQLKSTIMNAQKLHDMLEPDTDLPEWVQLKITLAEDYIVTAANYCATEMSEETLSALEAELVEEFELFEKAPPGSKYERMVKHIKAGYEKGGLTDKEKSIAYATAWKAYNKANEEVEQVDEAASDYKKAFAARAAKNLMKDTGKIQRKLRRLGGSAQKNYVGMQPKVDMSSKVTAAETEKGTYKEEVESVDEKYMGFKKVMAAAKEGGARDPAAVAAAIGRKKYGKEKFQAMAAAGKKANEEVVVEAEGSIPTTPKEKALAAHHGDPNRITFGDVIKARLKSAAAKKMGK